MTRIAERSAGLVGLLFVATMLSASAEDARMLLLGAAAWPGVAIEAGYVEAHTAYTLEVTLYCDGRLTFDGGRRL